jgi:hypothetical protein
MRNCTFVDQDLTLDQLEIIKSSYEEYKKSLKKASDVKTKTQWHKEIFVTFIKCNLIDLNDQNFIDTLTKPDRQNLFECLGYVQARQLLDALTPSSETDEFLKQIMCECLKVTDRLDLLTTIYEKTTTKDVLLNDIAEQAGDKRLLACNENKVRAYLEFIEQNVSIASQKFLFEGTTFLANIFNNRYLDKEMLKKIDQMFTASDALSRELSKLPDETVVHINIQKLISAAGPDSKQGCLMNN